eukprot:IDg18627t1
MSISRRPSAKEKWRTPVLYRLQKAEREIFTSLDATWGYWQILVKEENKEKTAFCSYEGLHQFNRMPFGLLNAPASFQRALDIILARYKWKTCLVYLDDVIVFSKNT